MMRYTGSIWSKEGFDRPTDVLSFPMVEYETPGDFGFLEEGGEDCFEPDSGELMLGDIVISADKVISQAEECCDVPEDASTRF